jgi:hypothetical protein
MSVPPALGTQMSPKAAAAGNGRAPTAIVFATVFVAGSIRETVFDPRFGTKTVPSSAIAAFSGWSPTLIVATTFRRFGSIRETVSERRFETQTAVLEAATLRRSGGSPAPRSRRS